MDLHLFDVVYFCALFAIPIILYKLLLPSNHGREKRVKDWYYAFKRVLCKQKLEKFMNRKVKFAPFQPMEATEYWQEDLLTFHGCDLQNNAIYLRFAVGKTECGRRFAEILVQLRLADGRIFQLPEETVICALRQNEWRTKILTISPQLNDNYRIIFNGFFKDVTKERSNNIEHISFNFLFSRATCYLNYPKFFNKGLFSDAICREQWRNGQWTHKLGDTIGQELFGTIHGTIKGSSFGIDSVWNLAAHQSRRFGTADRYNCDRSIALFALADDGMVVHVEKRHISSTAVGSCRITHGAVLMPNGKCFPIIGCDLPLPDNHGHLMNMTVHVATKAKGIKLFLSIETKQIETKLTSTHWNFGCEISNLTADTCIAGNEGKSSIVIYKRRPGSGVDLPNPLVDTNCAEESRPTSNDDRTVISLQSTEAKNLVLSGGKGRSLAILTTLQNEYDFIVPAGFVVTTTALEQHLQYNSNKSRACIAKLKMATDVEAMQTACQRIQDYIMETPLREGLKDAIIAEFRKLNGEKRRGVTVAVRSSGVSEDSDFLSAAGQNDSFLGCSTEEKVLAAVKKCWSSLYAFQSVEYRRNRGIDVETTMGVIIQRMVDSRIAGVLFTCDLDGNPSRMRITSNYGLGESIVSGKEHGDLVYVKRTWDNSISIESQEPHLKKTKIALNQPPKSGSQTVYLNDRDAIEMSISAEEAMGLTKVASYLERVYGRHLDIEWAYDGNRLVLLQARPVTFLENWTDYELEHEFDYPNICPENVFTTANVKEVMPGALTPLSTSTIANQVDKSIARCIRGSNQEIRDRLVTMRHHIFMSYYHVLLCLPTDDINITIRSIDISVCGHPVTTRPMLDRALHMHGRTTIFKTLLTIWDTLGYYWNTVKYLEKARRITAHLGVITEAYSLQDIIKQIDHHLKLFESVIYAHSVASRSASFFQMVSMNILGRKLDGKLTPANFAQISLLFSNGNGIISAEIPSELEAIATEIRISSKREEFIESSPEKIANCGWLQNNVPEADKIYQLFLTNHGHRSLREFEIMEASWRENPVIIISILQTLVKLKTSTKKAEHISIEQVIEQLHSNLNRKLLIFLIKQCRNGVINREKSKSEVVRHLDTIRQGFRALSERMEKLQYLPSKNLIYFLSYDEIKSLIEARDSVLVMKAIQRKRLYKKWNEYKFPEITFGHAKPLNDRKPANDGTTLKGTPVCPGIVTARCCCIDNLKDIGKLEQGDILVTHGTDVGWTPYFPMLSGIVTELGGLISHGAVIAREYGLPCLIGVQGALDTFRTGEHIVLDANNGCIYKINLVP